MISSQLVALASEFQRLRIAVVGDFCLDRYLEIDPARAEVSIETGLPVHNVTRIRSQPGAAGTVLSNLVALGVGEILPVGFCGEDGEGYELLRALRGQAGVNLRHFVQTPERRTFTYCKPLVLTPGEPPSEMSRFDSKNWSPTPLPLSKTLAESVESLASGVDGIIVMEQVEIEGTGVIVEGVLATIGRIARERPSLPVIADSRRGLLDYPTCVFKMNAAELASVMGAREWSLDQTCEAASQLARRNQRSVIITMAEQGIIASCSDGKTVHVPALPVRGPIDVVGAGDAVTAAVTATLAAGAPLEEAVELAALASSIVVHQLGTSGSASISEIQALCSN